jgi:phosphate transport system protein
MTQLRAGFDRDLDALKTSALTMGQLVTDMLSDSLNALWRKDGVLAREVQDRDAEADELDEAIETAATHLLALQQPVAGDLRTVTATLKMVTDLERIGDYAVAITRAAEAIRDEPARGETEKLESMGELTLGIVRDALHVYEGGDVELARAVRKQDKRIDVLWREIETQSVERMREDPGCIREATHHLLIARYLERVGDHAKNICERVAYMRTGHRKPWAVAGPGDAGSPKPEGAE